MRCLDKSHVPLLYVRSDVTTDADVWFACVVIDRLKFNLMVAFAMFVDSSEKEAS